MTPTRKPLVILAIVMGSGYALAEALLPEFPYKEAIGAFLLLGTFAIAALLGHLEYQDQKNRDSSKKQVEISSSMREEPLSAREISYLKRRMRRRMAVVMGTFLFGFCIYLVFAYYGLPLLLGKLGIYIFWMLSGVIFVTAVYLVVKRVRRLQQDIRYGKKLVLVGNLSRWEYYRYNETDLVFYVNEVGFRVKPAMLEKYAKGDAIEVHLFVPWQNLLLSTKKIEPSQ